MGALYVARVDCAGFVAGLFGVASWVTRESSLCDIGSRDTRRVGVDYIYSTYTKRTLTTTPKSLQLTRLSAALFGGRVDALGSSRSRGLFCIAVPAWLISIR
jgi:hypothetical protein